MFWNFDQRISNEISKEKRLSFHSWQSVAVFCKIFEKLDDEYRIKIENETFDDFVIRRPSSFISSEIGTRKMFFRFENFSFLFFFLLPLKFRIF